MNFSPAWSFPCIQCFQGQTCVLLGSLEYRKVIELSPVVCSISTMCQLLPRLRTCPVPLVGRFASGVISRQSTNRFHPTDTPYSQTKGRIFLLTLCWKLPARDPMRMIGLPHDLSEETKNKIIPYGRNIWIAFSHKFPKLQEFCHTGNTCWFTEKSEAWSAQWPVQTGSSHLGWCFKYQFRLEGIKSDTIEAIKKSYGNLINIRWVRSDSRSKNQVRISYGICNLFFFFSKWE